jgi:hypothetical protein
MNYSIDDYNLTAEQLEVKYGEKYEQHPSFPTQQWYISFLLGNRTEYWPWAVKQLELEADELDRDNPYN